MNDRFKLRWPLLKDRTNQFIKFVYGDCFVGKPFDPPTKHFGEPQQCTGIKDKNGKLIYEGDIVRSESYPFKSDNEYHYAAEVCFDEESAVFFYYVFRTSIKVAGRAEGNTGQLNECDWEVIGNIHENKEYFK